MKIDERPVGVKRITLLEDDGSETVINVTDDLHLLLGYARCGPDGGRNIRMEVIVKGTDVVVREILSRLGEEIDPGAEAFKRARPVGGVQ
jgi:hypothetical protein